MSNYYVQVLIDGHNLIGQISDIQLSDADDEDRLIFKLRQYRAKTGKKIMVVFDAGNTYKPGSNTTRGGITIQYAPHGITADAVIINYLRKAQHPRQILVVSSDHAIQRAAKLTGAQVISAGSFAPQLNAPPAAPSAPPEKPADDVVLSEAEITEWLELFKKNKKKKP